MPRCRPHTRSGLASASSRNGQWVKAMVDAVGPAGGLGVEAQVVELGHQRLDARAVRLEALGVLGPLLPAGVGGVVGVEAGLGGHAQQHAGQAGMAGGSRPSEGASAASE